MVKKSDHGSLKFGGGRGGGGGGVTTLYCLIEGLSGLSGGDRLVFSFSVHFMGLREISAVQRVTNRGNALGSRALGGRDFVEVDQFYVVNVSDDITRNTTKETKLPFAALAILAHLAFRSRSSATLGRRNRVAVEA